MDINQILDVAKNSGIKIKKCENPKHYICSDTNKEGLDFSDNSVKKRLIEALKNQENKYSKMSDDEILKPFFK